MGKKCVLYDQLHKKPALTFLNCERKKGKGQSSLGKRGKGKKEPTTCTL